MRHETADGEQIKEMAQTARCRRQKNKRFIFLLLVSCIMSLVSDLPAWAQAGKIGYINIAKVFDNYQRTKSSDVVLEKRGKQKEAELEGRLNELKKLRQNLELLNDEARDSKGREIEERADELQRVRTTAVRDLRRERDKIAKSILDDIQGAIKDYAKANGFSLIVDERSLLYGEDAYDLSDEILQVLNSRAAKSAAATNR
ncbi:MAG: OmpH family outer membrane protein [Candidatus Omnitrophica bacterium]|nr:OmpH family outer membrane protein [Candidatus Omnitrophota bacterium]